MCGLQEEDVVDVINQARGRSTTARKMTSSSADAQVCDGAAGTSNDEIQPPAHSAPVHDITEGHA